MPTVPAPNTSKQESTILGQPWHLACTIPSKDVFLCLQPNGKPIWQDTSNLDTPTGYRRDGFDIDLILSGFHVENHSYTWSCPQDSSAAQLPQSKSDYLSLRNFGKRLVIFERKVVIKDPALPPQQPREDKKGCLKAESTSHGVWCITGTDIYQVEGDDDDLVIQSPTYLRLWNIAKKNFRWEFIEPREHRFGLCDKYVVVQGGH